MLVSGAGGPAAPNYYQALGLSFMASDVEIRGAYRRLALKLHPDRHPQDADAVERFLAIVEAYEVLSDPAHRLVYDTACQYWLSVEEYLNEFSELLLTVSGLGLRTDESEVACSLSVLRPKAGLLTAA